MVHTEVSQHRLKRTRARPKGDLAITTVFSKEPNYECSLLLDQIRIFFSLTISRDQAKISYSLHSGSYIVPRGVARH